MLLRCTSMQACVRACLSTNQLLGDGACPAGPAAARRKLRDAQEGMAGEQGRGRLVGLHQELVGRRCLMVSQLGELFQLGPMTGGSGVCGWTGHLGA